MVKLLHNLGHPQEKHPVTKQPVNHAPLISVRTLYQHELIGNKFGKLSLVTPVQYYQEFIILERERESVELV